MTQKRIKKLSIEEKQLYRKEIRTKSEYYSFKQLLEKYPNGVISLVSDTFNLWEILTKVLPSLHDIILKRNGKLVCRPDSGNPVDIICGKEIEDYSDNEYVVDLASAISWAHEDNVEKERENTPHGECGDDALECVFKYNGKYYRLVSEIMWNRHDKQYYYIDGHDIESCEEYAPTPADLGVIELLWNEFGGTVNELGYKVLDSHVGAIYGDSITLERAEQICKRLASKGFASTNVVLGIGSYTYNYVTRDTFGMAMKATYCEVNGEERAIFKDPITSDGEKKSLKGLLTVERRSGIISVRDNVSKEEEERGLLEVVFENGKLVREYSLSDIRERLKNG